MDIQKRFEKTLAPRKNKDTLYIPDKVKQKLIKALEYSHDDFLSNTFELTPPEDLKGKYEY